MSEKIDLVIIGKKMKKEGRRSNYVGERQPYQKGQKMKKKKVREGPQYVGEN